MRAIGVVAALLALASEVQAGREVGPTRLALIRLDYENVEEKDRAETTKALIAALPKRSADFDFLSPQVLDDRGRIELGKRLAARLLLEVRVWHDRSPDDGSIEWVARMKIFDAEGGGEALGADEIHCAGCTRERFVAQLPVLVTKILALDKNEPTSMLNIRTNPPVKGLLRIDRRAMGWVPFEERLFVGTHQIEVEAEGYRLASSEVVLRKGVPADVMLTLQPDGVNPPNRDPRVPKTTTGTPNPSHPLRIAGGVLLGIGLAGVGAGAGLLAFNGHQDCQLTGALYQCSRTFDSTGGGAALVAIGGASVIAGIVMLIVDAKAARAQPASTGRAQRTLRWTGVDLARSTF